MGRLNGKVALISGGARGMGAAFAADFAAEGAKVVVGDIIGIEDATLAANDAVRHVTLDVRREESWRAAVAETEAAFGRLDILVNNAGIQVTGSDEGPIEDIEEANFRRIIDVNQVGLFLGMKTAIPALRRGGAGAIVNIVSTTALLGPPHMLAYTASKWAALGMTKAAATDLGHYNIRVNAVLPGIIATPIHTFDQSAEAAQRTMEGLAAAQSKAPIKRVGDPREVAKVVLFLASDEASFCTGAHYVVDGGHTIV